MEPEIQSQKVQDISTFDIYLNDNHFSAQIIKDHVSGKIYVVVYGEDGEEITDPEIHSPIENLLMAE